MGVSVYIGAYMADMCVSEPIWAYLCISVYLSVCLEYLGASVCVSGCI